MVRFLFYFKKYLITYVFKRIIKIFEPEIIASFHNKEEAMQELRSGRYEQITVWERKSYYGKVWRIFGYAVESYKTYGDGDIDYGGYFDFYTEE